jgi:flagellar biosynthesis protein FlhG
MQSSQFETGTSADSIRGEIGAQANPLDALTQAVQPGQKVIAVGGGKGGIGKSLISANLGVHLASRGAKVVLVDADLGGANLHTCLGIPTPALTLSDFIGRKVDNLADVVTETNTEGLGLISGALDVLGAANPKYTQKLRLLREISRLGVDYVIVDLGGGTGFNILDFFLIAEHGILTVIPEPTSIENAYRFIKAAYYRRLKHLQASWNFKPLLRDAISDPDSRGLKTPADLVAYVAERNDEAGELLHQELSRMPLKLVVNQARTEEEYKLGGAITRACHKYFGIGMEFLGTIPYDDAVWKSVRRREPLLVAHPDCGASRGIREIVTSLGL